MFNSSQQLLSKIRFGEDSLPERKEARRDGERIVAPNRQSFADERASFASAHGGVCVLGVRDKDKQRNCK